MIITLKSQYSAFALLDKLVDNNALNSSNQLPAYAPKLITEVVLPSVIWRPGREAALIRGRGLQVLVDTILANIVTKADLDFMFEPSLAPAFIGCIDDDDIGSRQACLHVLKKIFQDDVLMTGKLMVSLSLILLSSFCVSRAFLALMKLFFCRCRVQNDLPRVDWKIERC